MFRASPAFRRLAELEREALDACVDLCIPSQVEREHHAHADAGVAASAECYRAGMLRGRPMFEAGRLIGSGLISSSTAMHVVVKIEDTAHASCALGSAVQTADQVVVMTGTGRRKPVRRRNTYLTKGPKQPTYRVDDTCARGTAASATAKAAIRL
jgi:hypothetical protein